jgi:hypothetical protein
MNKEFKLLLFPCFKISYVFLNSIEDWGENNLLKYLIKSKFQVSYFKFIFSPRISIFPVFSLAEISSTKNTYYTEKHAFLF